MEYYGCSVVNSIINDHSVSSRDGLKRKTYEKMRRIDEEEVTRARTCFRARLRVDIRVVHFPNSFIFLGFRSDSHASFHAK